MQLKYACVHAGAVHSEVNEFATSHPHLKCRSYFDFYSLFAEPLNIPSQMRTYCRRCF